MPNRVFSRGVLALVAALVVPIGVTSTAGPAQAVDPVAAPKLAEVSADVRVQPDGSLRVREVHAYDFGAEGPSGGERRFATRVNYDADHDQVYTIRGLSATLGGKPVKATASEEDGTTTYALNYGAAPKGKRELSLTYVVEGAVRETPEGRELAWPVVQGLQSKADAVTVNLTAPRVTWAACFAGRTGSSIPCTSTQLSERSLPRFDQEGLDAGERMTLMVGIPTDAGVSADQELERRWSLGRAFAVTPTSVGLLLGLVLLGILGVVALWWTRGRDAAARAAKGASYDSTEPPDGVRPGQMGTVVDERADVVDVVATVLDLAVRGVLVIEGSSGSWRVAPGSSTDSTNSSDSSAELAHFERVVVELVGDGVDLLDPPESWREALPAIQDRLYADVLANRWFTERPDAARGRWTTAGVVLALAGAALTVVLALTTDLGLVGLGVILAGAALAWGGDVAPARTARGSALTMKLHEFREHLSTGDVSEEDAPRLLPYAVVFGVEGRWRETASAASEALPAELQDFVTTLSGAISASRRLLV